MDEQARGEHPAETARAGIVRPEPEVLVLRRAGIQRLAQLLDQPAAAAGDPAVVQRGLEHLAQVVEGRLLADGDLAANEPPGEGLLLQVRQQVGLSGAEVSGDQHPRSASRQAAFAGGTGQQIVEAAFGLGLAAAQDPDRLRVGHTVAERLQRPAAGQRAIVAGASGHGSVPASDSRTRDAAGLTRLRSRTSSITRVRKAW